MNLSDRRGGERLPVEARENTVDGAADGLFNSRSKVFERNCRHSVLQG